MMMMAYPTPPVVLSSISTRPKIQFVVVILAISLMTSLVLYGRESKFFKSAMSLRYSGIKWNRSVSTHDRQEGIIGSLNYASKLALDMIPFQFDGDQDEIMEDESGTSVDELLTATADYDINWVYDGLNFSEQNSFITFKKDRFEQMEKNGTLKTWSETNKLKVFVVLHSHNDAGWGQTFEEYFRGRSQSILNYVLDYLTNDPELKFIWCETSFFSLWWEGLTSEKRGAVKKIIETRQLEFVGGGWVMPDEANVHYLSYFMQLIEGHQFLQQHLNITVRNGWAIDPFGLSSTLNFLQTKAGINTSVFSRIHHALAAFLRRENSVEFLWRQQWDKMGISDVLSYLMPYGSYDSSITCGDGLACAFFKGDLIPTEQLNTSASLILEALRKKAQLFNTNNLLYPIGGDFRWGSTTEWTNHAQNIKNVMKYVNSHEELNTEMKFATLDEYFTAIDLNIQNGSFKPKSLIGDFFTYSDKPYDYWSGYYTSRAFHKATERQLMTALRTAQLVFTMMTAELYKGKRPLGEVVKFIQELLPQLVQSQRNLSIFQHHDGITGTSTDLVVKDYSLKMFTALQNCEIVTRTSMLVLGNLEVINKMKDFALLSRPEKSFSPALHKDGDMSIFRLEIFKIDNHSDVKTNKNKIITVFNPLETFHIKLVKIGISHPNVKVTTYENEMVVVPHEIFPIFSELVKESKTSTPPTPTLKVLSDSFELNFIAELKPLEIRHYKIVPTTPSFEAGLSKVRVENYNVVGNYESSLDQVFEMSNPGKLISSSTASWSLMNDQFNISFNSNGELEMIKNLQTDLSIPVKISFKYYESQKGLYSFFPEGEAKAIQVQEPVMIIVKGKLQSYVEVWLEEVVRHRVTLYKDGIDKYALDILNVIDITKRDNYELLMHLSTPIKTEDTFYTDSNGFQMMQRKRRDNFPIQGNYYPVASAAFIEDDQLRMTVLAAQPGGGASLKSGELEIMQDRRILSDDGHGISQGGKDNVLTVSHYKIMFETPKRKVNPKAVPSLSLAAQHQLRNLLHPVPTFVETEASSIFNTSNFQAYIPSLENYTLPCDIVLALTQPLPKYKDSEKDKDFGISFHPGDRVGLIFNRVGFDKRFSSKALINICNSSSTDLGKLNVGKLFGDLYKKYLRMTGVTFIHEMEEINGSDNFLMEAMDVNAFTAQYQRKPENPWKNSRSWI